MTNDKMESNRDVEHYLNLFDLELNEIDEGIFVFDDKGNYLQANNTGANIFGYSVSEITGMSIGDLVYEGWYEHFKKYLELTSRGEKILIEMPMKTKGGTTVYIELSARKLPHGNVLGVKRDITKRIAHSYSGIERYNKLNELHKHVKIGHWDWDYHKNVLNWSDEIFEIFGVSRELFEVTGENFETIIHREDVTNFIDKRTKAIETGNDVDIEYRIIRPDCEVRYIYERVRIINDSDCKPLWVLGTVHDITERKAFENKVVGKTEYLERLLDIVPSAVYTVDNQREITSWNKRAESLTGYSAEEVLGKGCMMFACECCTVKCGLLADDVEKPVVNRICTIKKKDGEIRKVAKSVEEIYDGYGKVIGGIICFEDITEKLDFEKKITDARIKAEAASVAKSQFLANMSHEIRTPMNGIMGFLDILSFTDLTSEQMEYISQAKTSSNILLNLINDILDLSKIEAGKLALEEIKFELKPLIESTIEMFRPKISEKNLQVHLYIQQEISSVHIGDANRLKQVMINLLSNAIKFTNSGIVCISVHKVKENGGSSTLSFKVKDTGIGIKKEYLNELFNPFSQQDASMSRQYGGTGLGLSITKSLVQLMGGEILVDSKEGEGTCFTFNITFKKYSHMKGQVIKDLSQKEKLNNFHAKNCKILIVEDNELNASIVKRMMERKGYCYEVVSDGLQAVKTIERNEYDIVLMDCQMPVMDGYKATRLIRDNKDIKKQPAIIAMTANAMEGDRQKVIDAGMDDYISKPIDFSAMFELIDKHLNSQENGEDTFRFTDDLKSGNELIDKQHMELFRFTNELIMTILKDNNDLLTVEDKVKALEGYVLFHFTEEEMMMERHDYPLILTHQKMHQYFLSELNKVKRFKEEPRKALNYLKDFLIGWLIMHIKSSDKDMADFCKDNK